MKNSSLSNCMSERSPTALKHFLPLKNIKGLCKGNDIADCPPDKKER